MSDSNTNTETKNKGTDEKRDGLFPSLKRRKPVDFGIQSAAVVAAIFGIAIAVVSVFNLRNKESVVLWLGYFAVLFTLLAFTLYWQKRVWENVSASTARAAITAPVPAQESARPFSLAVEFVFGSGQRKMESWHWVTYDGEGGMTACPVSVALNLRLMNQRSVPATIIAFRVEAKNKKNEWVKLSMMDVHSPGHELYYVVGPHGLKQADKMDMKTICFDYLMSKRVPPHEPVRGWAFFAAPEEVRVEDGDVLRIYVKDAVGMEMTDVVMLGEDMENAVRSSDSFNYQRGIVEDISSYKLRYWGEYNEQPE